MEKKIEMVEVYGTQDLKALVGCMVNAVTDTDDGEGNEGISLDCSDENGNIVCLAISEDGSMHFYDEKREGITAEQCRELVMLAGCLDIDTVHFNNADPLIEIVIKPIGTNAADRVMTILKGIFPMLEVEESQWDYLHTLQPMYCCSDPNFYLIITVSVLPMDFNDGTYGD